MFAGPCLRKKGVESIIATANGFVARHLTIRLDAMFQAKTLPTCITNLDASLANVDAKCLTHFGKCRVMRHDLNYARFDTKWLE